MTPIKIIMIIIFGLLFIGFIIIFEILDRGKDQ